MDRMENRRAVFLDRDGVINRNRSDYVKSWSEFEFLDGALAALARLAETDFHVLVITNQSAIARALTSREQVEEIHRRMVEQAVRSGGRVDDILYCPHHPDEGCACRKPQPGLILRAGARHHLDLASSYMVGDSLEDMQAGLAAGCTLLLVRTGRGAEAIARLDQWPGPHPFIVDDLAGAVTWILQEHRLG
ncbi:MAG: D-glycero-beta-D-manno-heptose 1,7-bisphosphate 7-phosphatase [Anaerolineae bacterium]